jgi:hypothetical protein
MMTRTTCFFAFLLGITLFCTPVISPAAPPEPLTGASWDFSHGPIRVSEDARSLVHEDGTRFLWIGDTAWELFHRLTRDEAEFYLEKRRSQGFTVIQAVALAEFSGLIRPTPAGHLPLIENDPASPMVKDGPDNDYWDDVDFVVETAAGKGLYIAMLPTWGDKVLKKWGQGPEIFTPENAEAYGRFLGERYGNRPNMIWILGGDRPSERELDFAVWRAMARGIKAGELSCENGFAHVMTYHPSGEDTSSRFFHNDDWLDFNMFQSGHRIKDGANYKMVARDRGLKPVKPVLDGEPRYENHPVRSDQTKTQWFDDFDVRQAAYWAVFAGAFGHTYGCHDIWMMYDGTPERQCADARTPWKQSVDLPGAWQMLILRNFLLNEGLLKSGHVPCQELIVGDNPDGTGYAVACCTQNRDKAFVYVPTGRKVTLDLGKLKPAETEKRFHLFNPRTGETVKEVAVVEDGNFYTVTLPGKEERGNDWVIVIEQLKE